MCGLSGYCGLEHVELELRVSIFMALGEGSDRRGGHAAGLAAFSKGDTTPFIRKKLGDAMSYDDECLAFVDLGSRHETLLLHTRYATTDARSVNDAHPFTIVRDGAPVLHGMHNGIIYNARDMAEKHGRPYTVDSLEMFEILADAFASNDFSTFSELQGYGVIVWVTASEPECIHFCRLTDDGDLVIAALKGGGIMWASTKSILEQGLKAGDLEVEHFYKIKTGEVYKASDGRLYMSDIRLSIRSRDIFSADYYASRGLSGASYASMADILRMSDDLNSSSRRRKKTKRDRLASWSLDVMRAAREARETKYIQTFGYSKEEAEAMRETCARYEIDIYEAVLLGEVGLEDLIDKIDLCDDYGLDRALAFDSTYKELEEATTEVFGSPRQGNSRSRSFIVDGDDDELPITQDIAEE
jgi:hypothetical protein